MLKRLALGAMTIADAVEQQALRQAQSDTPGPGAAAAGLLYTRLMRAIRQAIALDKKLAETRHAHLNPSPAEQSRRDADTRQRRRIARTKIRQCMRDAIAADPDLRDRENLLADLEDRLGDDEIDNLLLTRSVNDIVLDLCKELGIDPNLAQWTDQETEKSFGPDTHAPLSREEEFTALRKSIPGYTRADYEEDYPPPARGPPD